MQTFTCTYCPSENKFRLYSSSRLDETTYQRVKAAGFRWAPKQECFFAPAWTVVREDLMLELCGQIDDEDTSLVDRAEARAERFETYSDHRTADATAAHKRVGHIMDGIPLGQPILVGHHSEAHARRDAKRIEQGTRRAINMWEQAQYWQDRATGALRHAKYKELPAVRARRIKTLEAELRKVERSKKEGLGFLHAWQEASLTQAMALNIANYDHLSQCFLLADYPREPPASQYEGRMGLWSALTDGVITCEHARELAILAHERAICHWDRWIAHLNNRLAYERALLGESAGIVADQTKPEKGGACQCWVQRGAWCYIVKVNKVSVTLRDDWGYANSRIFTRNIPFDKLTAIMSAAQVQAKQAAGLTVEHKSGISFYLLDTPPASPKAEASPKPAPFDVDALKDTLKAGIKVTIVPQLFPTPPELAARMVGLADIQPGDHILEPSAGTGTLARAIALLVPKNQIKCYDIDAGCVYQLQQQGFFVNRLDFLTVEAQPAYDAVVMNPPFHGGEDLSHVTHALQFLKPGGRLVAVMSAGVTFTQSTAHKDFRLLVEQYDGTITPLHDDTFASEGTSVRTVLVQITLPELP